MSGFLEGAIIVWGGMIVGALIVIVAIAVRVK